MAKKPTEQSAAAEPAPRVYLTLEEAAQSYKRRDGETVYAVALENGGIRYVPSKAPGKAAIAATGVIVKPVPQSEINEALNAVLAGLRPSDKAEESGE